MPALRRDHLPSRNTAAERWPAERLRCAGLGAVTAVWLLISPGLLAYPVARVALVQAVAATVLLAVAAVALTMDWRSAVLDWAVAGAGGAVLIAGVAMAAAPAPRWNAVLVGAAVLVAGALRASGRIADEI